VEWSENSTQRVEFGNKVLGKSPSQLHAYWSKIIFTRKGKLLKEVGSAKELKEYWGVIRTLSVTLKNRRSIALSK
jgi:hypothetical protein